MQERIKSKFTSTRLESLSPATSPMHATVRPLGPLRLPRTSLPDPKLFNYEEFSSIPSPYPPSKFTLNNVKLKQWLSQKVQCDDKNDSSDDDSNDEEDKNTQGEQREVTTPLRVGPKAMADFFGKFRVINKVMPPMEAKRPSATYHYLRNIDRLHRIPQPLGIVKWKGYPNELNLQSYKIGDSYAEALSDGLGYMNPEFVNLADNRLTNAGSKAIIKNLKPSIKYLNISQNILSNDGATILGDVIKSRANNLRGLNLENTKLGDNAAILLCKQLVDHPRLIDVNLAKNHLTDASCEAIAQMVYDTFYLSTLILHWNLITGEGASKILKATTRYSNIKVIDFSWNTIGSFKGKLFANQLSEILTTQENLIHLDLSHNKIKSEECRTIACALTLNHSLWGFHFLGNGTCSVDSKGFIKDELVGTSFGADHLESRINGARMVVANLEREESKIKRVSNCWICEGWSEAVFDWSRAGGITEPVYLCLECDGYEADLMDTEPDVPGCNLWRMCPPGRTKFFFITEGRPKLSDKYRKMSCNFATKIKLNDEMYPNVDVKLTEINYIEAKPNPNIVKESYEVTIQNCVPRPMPGFHHRPKAKKQRAPWSIPISLFKDYVPDSDKLLMKCFEEDWKRMTKPKMKEESMAKCKELLRKSYKIIRDAYKYYAAIGRTENMFTINKLTLTDFIAHKIFLYDGDKLTDMDLTFSAVKGRPKTVKFQPRTALVRFELLELLLRLAIKRYYDSKEVTSEPAAVEKLLAVNIMPNCSKFDCQSFRDTRYWNEECDNILKSHLSLFDSLYDSNSGSRRLPGEKNFMCYDEFIGMLTAAGLVTDEFPERDAIEAFAQSMMTQVDEFDNDRHMRMQRVEFYEAVARAAEGLSLAPASANPEEWPIEKRQAQLLCEKMDNLVPVLLPVAKKEFREKFKKPERDKSTGLYIVAGDSPTKAPNAFVAKV